MGGEVGRISELLGGVPIDEAKLEAILIKIKAANKEPLHIINKALQNKKLKNFQFYQILCPYGTRHIIYIATIMNVHKTNNSRF